MTGMTSLKSAHGSLLSTCLTFRVPPLLSIRPAGAQPPLFFHSASAPGPERGQGETDSSPERYRTRESRADPRSLDLPPPLLSRTCPGYAPYSPLTARW